MSSSDDKKRKREERRRNSDEQQTEALRRMQQAHRAKPGDGKRRPMQPHEQPWIELPNGERLYTDVLPEDASAYEAEDADDVIRYDFEGFEDDLYGPNHRRRRGTWDIPGT